MPSKLGCRVGVSCGSDISDVRSGSARSIFFFFFCFFVELSPSRFETTNLLNAFASSVCISPSPCPISNLHNPERNVPRRLHNLVAVTLVGMWFGTPSPGLQVTAKEPGSHTP